MTMMINALKQTKILNFSIINRSSSFAYQLKKQAKFYDQSNYHRSLNHLIGGYRSQNYHVQSSERFKTASSRLSIPRLRSSNILRWNSTDSIDTSRSNPFDRTNPSLSSPILSSHLFLIATLVFSIVIVGGLTRLTESGLSITEWNLVSGILPPLNEDEWEREFSKYRSTPEWKLLNRSIQMDQFKTIYYWEWAHRMIGRAIGIAFLVPIPIMMRRGVIRGKDIGWSLVGIGSLIGAQGGLGWYMVKSGLDQVELDQRDGVPRVSQYRLAAHLLMAFTVYSACLRLGGGIWRDWRLAIEGKPLDHLFNQKAPKTFKPELVMDSIRLLQSKTSSRARVFINLLTGLVFITAGSGAFVAGLDAGLVYNTFPKMGERWIPPKSELIAEQYSKRGGKGGEIEGEEGYLGKIGWMKNFFENPTTVQFDHRILATLTFFSTMGWFGYVYKNRASLPKSTMVWSRRMIGMVSVQVGLGISTLVYLVPINLAAAHQAGSLILLSLSLGCGLSLRRPSLRALKEYQRRIASIKSQ